MAEQNPQDLYNAFYYRTGCGPPYQRDEHWMAFFGRIAETIVERISPRSVLDAGCAFGLLVEQLRLLGVEAEGVDISEFAIASAPETVRPHVRAASITEPFGRRYDLIVCIEVLEHMPQRDAEAAIANLTAHSDDILFASSPLDFKEATHVNVHPIEHWVELFATHGFVRDVDFDASFVTPWAMRLRRRADPLPRIVRDYERRFWEVWKASTDLRELVLNQRKQIEAAHENWQNCTRSLEACNRSLSETQREYAQSVAKGRQDVEDLKAYIARLEADLAQKIAHINELKTIIARLESGRVMRILRALEARRARFFRSGTRD
ncbi:MAG: class I SAM-dependent methyltransferase [Chloroflexaceae bacterium]|nr:class I SAM-dependent methyltransferase [Chloroflexaceae bacterium]